MTLLLVVKVLIGKCVKDAMERSRLKCFITSNEDSNWVLLFENGIFEVVSNLFLEMLKVSITFRYLRKVVKVVEVI